MDWMTKSSVLGALVLAVAVGCPAEPSVDPMNATTAPTASGGQGPSPLSVNPNGDTIQIDEAWKGCQSADDCVLVWTSCDGCCGQDAIATEFEEDYDASTPALCEGYDGGVCDCAPLPTTVECVELLCTLVPVEEGETGSG